MSDLVGYLGPKGSHSYDVAVDLGGDFEKLIPLNQLEFHYAFSKGIISRAVLPFENNVGGQVNWVINLLGRVNYLITEEKTWNISHCLLGFGRIGQINKVRSHPQALDQCSYFLERMPSLVQLIKTDSTSSAVQLISKEKDPTLAAIGTIRAADIYKVPILEQSIDNEKNNKTRFIVLGGNIPFPTGNDKTSLIVKTLNKPGALLEVLKILKNINITCLISLPSNNKIGEYSFLLELDGHIKEIKISVAISKIKKTAINLKFLGSYPRN